MNRCLARVLAVAVAVLCCAEPGALAQSAPRLIGVTSGVAPDLSRQQACAVPVFQRSANATVPGSGGAAYNPIRGSLFYTDGVTIYEIEVNRGTWTELCHFAPFLVRGGRLEGLTFDVARRELLALESLAGAAVVHTLAWDAANCLVETGLCTVSNIPSANHVGGGIAYDVANDAVHVAMSVRSGAPNTMLLSWPRTSPCHTQCRTALNGCGLGAVLALAFDPSSAVLYASDGRTTGTFALPGLCQTPRPLGCCTASHPAGNTWSGFDVVLCTVRGTVRGVGLPGCRGITLPVAHTISHGNGACGPLQGTPTTYEAVTFRPGALGLLLFGASTEFWNGTPLPLDLGILGMPNCTLNQDIFFSLPLQADPTFLGRTRYVATWLVQPAMTGVTLYTTVAVFDASANPFGMLLSNTMGVTHGRL